MVSYGRAYKPPCFHASIPNKEVDYGRKQNIRLTKTNLSFELVRSLGAGRYQILESNIETEEPQPSLSGLGRSASKPSKLAPWLSNPWTRLYVCNTPSPRIVAITPSSHRAHVTYSLVAFPRESRVPRLHYFRMSPLHVGRYV